MVFSYISGLSLFIIGMFFLVHDKVQVHPYPLLAYATLSSGIYFLSHYGGYNVICTLKLPYTIDTTTRVGQALFLDWNLPTVISEIMEGKGQHYFF
mmetsp:Transcript_29303/g.44137  ORF Transcript_29303/g.44137 Transcript_29303/m.44137 type:complete len:96 (+) Transcript_29303:309-596(+)